MLATNFEINPDFMLDTLSFSQNMQQAGMAKEIADMLAFNLKNLQINQLENLLTKNEFRIFEKEMRNFQIKMEEFRIEMKDFKQEVKTDIDELKTEMKDFKQELFEDSEEKHDLMSEEDIERHNINVLCRGFSLRHCI